VGLWGDGSHHPQITAQQQGDFLLGVGELPLEQRCGDGVSAVEYKPGKRTPKAWEEMGGGFKKKPRNLYPFECQNPRFLVLDQTIVYTIGLMTLSPAFYETSPLLNGTERSSRVVFPLMGRLN